MWEFFPRKLVFVPATGWFVWIEYRGIRKTHREGDEGKTPDSTAIDVPFFLFPSFFHSFSFFFFVSLAFNLNDAFSFRISRSFRWHFKSWRWSENRNKSRFNLRLGDVLCLRFYWFHCMLHALLRLYFIALMSSKCMNAIFFVLTDLVRIRGKSDESTFVIWFG